MYLPVIAGLVAALCWGLSDYVITKPTRALGQNRTTPYVLLFSALTIIPALFYSGISPNFDPYVLVFALVSPIATFLGFLFAYRAFRYGNLSITAPIVGSYPVITVLGAIFILGDKLSYVQLIAIVAVLLGIALTSTKFSSFKTKQKLVAIGVGSAILAMIVFGIPGLFAATYIALIGYAVWSLIGRGLGSVFAFIYGALKKEDLSIPKRKYLVPIIFAGVLDGFGMLVYYYALFANKTVLPIISTLAGFAGGITVICALILLKERPEKNQQLGIVIAIIGVVLLSYFS